MRILFDQGTPVPVGRFLAGHEVTVSADLGWDRLKNGDLLTAAQKAEFNVLLTTDKNLQYLQNLKDRIIAIVVIGHSQWPALKPHIQLVVDAVNSVRPGSYIEAEIPLPSLRARLPRASG